VIIPPLFSLPSTSKGMLALQNYKVVLNLLIVSKKKFQFHPLEFDFLCFFIKFDPHSFDSYLFFF